MYNDFNYVLAEAMYDSVYSNFTYAVIITTHGLSCLLSHFVPVHLYSANILASNGQWIKIHVRKI